MKTVDPRKPGLASKRILHACGAVMAIGIFAIAAQGVIAESGELSRQGPSSFFHDAVPRLAFGACIAIFSAAPYLLLARAATHIGPPRYFAITGVLVLAIQLSLTAKALFFGRASTAAIGVLFIPLYLCAAVVAICFVTAIAQKILRRGL